MQQGVDEFETNRNKHLKSITKKRVIRIIAVILVWALVIVYMVMPVSKMKNITVTGNVFLKDSKIIDIACIDSSTFRWDFDEEEAEKMINNYKFNDYAILSGAEIKNTLFSVSLRVNETFPLGILGEEVLLSNGKTIPLDYWYSDVPKYYQEAVGYLPELNITMLSDNSLNDFIKFTSKTSDGFVELRSKKELLTISNIEVVASPEDEVYVFTFKEVRSGVVYDFKILLSPSRVCDKLTYEFYNETTNNAIERANNSGIDSTLYNITIDCTGSWTIIDIE